MLDWAAFIFMSMESSFVASNHGDKLDCPHCYFSKSTLILTSDTAPSSLGTPDHPVPYSDDPVPYWKGTYQNATNITRSSLFIDCESCKLLHRNANKRTTY